MKKFLDLLLAATIIFAVGWGVHSLYKTTSSSITPSQPTPLRPLEKYTIEKLSQVQEQEGRIEIKEILEEEKDFTSYLFSFEFDPGFTGKQMKKSTGQINIPNDNDSFPIIIMLRGYVDQEIYETGIGTRKAGSVFAESGFITIAPDFLGYAGSDKEAENIFEARFQTYATVLSLIESLEQINEWDRKNVFLWGHSNGGQIALTILEITRANFPTILWAPVSKPFPYSILYYTDEAEDKGKYLRRELGKFEDLYDTDLYSIDNYFDRINTAFQIHQGTADDAIPVEWSNELVETLEQLDIDVNYYKYEGANHNLVPSWDTVVSRNLVFYKKHLK